MLYAPSAGEPRSPLSKWSVVWITRGVTNQHIDVAQARAGLRNQGGQPCLGGNVGLDGDRAFGTLKAGDLIYDGLTGRLSTRRDYHASAVFGHALGDDPVISATFPVRSNSGAGMTYSAGRA